MKNVELIKGMDYLGYGIKAYKGKPFVVEDDKAEKLVASGFFKIIGEASHDNVDVSDGGNQTDDLKTLQKPVVNVPKEVDFDKMKTAELEAYAQEHEIDISACRTNAERAAIIKAVIARSDGESESDSYDQADGGLDDGVVPDFDD